MKLIIDIPDNEIPTKQDILSVDLHFIDGTVCECDYLFEVVEEKDGHLCKNHRYMGDEMRDATQEELASVNDYIKSISKPTGIFFYDYAPCYDAISRKTLEQMPEKENT